MKLRGPDGVATDATGLAESLLTLLREELQRRMVLELEEVLSVSVELVTELMRLHDLLEAEGGLLRLSGLSKEHQEAWRGIDGVCHLPQYHNREEAVMGFYRPGKPR